jgi:hypothetical protein
MSKPDSKRPLGALCFFLLCLVAGAFLVLPVTAADKPVVTVVAQGSGAYYLGEEAVFSGTNTAADSTYLYLTGPNVPANGGKLSAPGTAVVSGNANTFTVVTTAPDKTWKYSWFTNGLLLDAGSYTVYAASGPQAADQLADVAYGTTSIIVKRPYLSANMPAPTVVKGVPVTVTGIAAGIPPGVQVWIFGDNYAFMTKTPVSSDGNFTFTIGAEMSGNLPAGQNYLIVEHPMADNRSDFTVNDAFVRDLKTGNGTDLFKIMGPGSLQGRDAAEALIAAMSARETHDSTYTNDTYVIIPFTVTGTGSASAAGPGVTISADGIKSYYLGEKVILRGRNTDSNTTYLFLSGPDTFKNGPGIPPNGGKLTAPLQAVASGDLSTFTVVKTKPDNSWEYSWYTANLPVDAGTYNVYAVSQPKALDQAGPAAAGDGIILKKPFITAVPSASSVIQGQPFTVTGTAEGDVPNVQVWIIGNNSVYTAKTPVNPDATFTFTADAALSGKLTAGQYYLFVQHPMQDNQFDIGISGDYVRNAKLGNGTNLFRITGPGSLQGADAADALAAAFSDTEARDDTYTVIPLQVTAAGSSTAGQAASGNNPLHSLVMALRSLF